MRRWLSLFSGFAAVAAGASSLAATAVQPLLVVVESRPGGGVDPVEVRQTVAAELRTTVRAPQDAEAEETPDLLIVAVDGAEIRMSLRANAASVISRSVPAPSGRKARLQSIGWLAGNLARDQVSALVAPAPARLFVSEAPIALEPVSRTEVPPTARTPATEPPPLADSASRESAAAAGGLVAARTAPAADGSGTVWSLAIGGGPSALWSGTGYRDQPVWPGPGVWYLEVQRRAAATSLILGAALEVGPDVALGVRSPSLEYLGTAALVGAGHRFGRTFVEATAGLGLEAYQGTSLQMTRVTSAMGVELLTQSFPTTSLGLYLRGQTTAGLVLSRSFDLLASVGATLET